MRNSKSLKSVPLNLREPYQIEKKFRKALNHLDGQLDCLILCHGTVKEEGILNTNMLEWDNMMNINCRTHFHLVSIAVPFLKLTKGNVVVVSSAQGETPAPGSIINSTASAMLNMLVKCSSLETSFYGVRINAVAPGITETDVRTKSEPDTFTIAKNRTFLKEAAQDVPLGNSINQAKDIA